MNPVQWFMNWFAAAGSGKSGPPALSITKAIVLSPAAVQDGGVGVPHPEVEAERYPGLQP